MKAFKILGILLFIFNLIWTLFNRLALNFYLKASLSDYFQNHLFWTDFCFCFLLTFGFIALVRNNKFLLLAFFLLFILLFGHHTRMINMYFLNNMPIWLLDMLIQGILYCLLLIYIAIYLSIIFYRQEILTIRKSTYTKIAIGLFLLTSVWSFLDTQYFLYTFSPIITPDTRLAIWHNLFFYILELIIFLLGSLYQNKGMLILAFAIFTYYLLSNLIGLAGLLSPLYPLQLIPAIDNLLGCLIWFYLLILLTNNRYRLIKFIPA